MDFNSLTKVAIEAALAAGKIIQENTDRVVAVENKKGGTSHASQVVTAVDKACEADILSHLLPTCEEFDIALLSEEIEDDNSRFQQDYFWCIDPMDGTLSFIEKRPGYSVSIALVAQDGTPHIGVVYDPTTDTIYHASKGSGVFKNGLPWNIIQSNDHLTYVTDRRLKDTPRLAELETLLHNKVGELGLTGVQEISGSGSVLNAILALENAPACMLKFPKKEDGCGSIWDFAATACIYNELDFTCTNFHGGLLDLNRPDGTFMNHQGIYYATFS